MNVKYILYLLSLGLLALFSCKKDEFRQPDWAYCNTVIGGQNINFNSWSSVVFPYDTSLISMAFSVSYIENVQKAESCFIKIKKPFSIGSKILFDNPYQSDTTNISWKKYTGHGDTGGPAYEPDTSKREENYIIINEYYPKIGIISGEYICNFIKSKEWQDDEFKNYPDSFHVEGKFKMPFIKY